jgi:two-component system sensor histidine kinase TtrS
VVLACIGGISLIASADSADSLPRDEAAMPLQVEIGVLSHRGDVLTQRHWSPTADYLSRALPGHRFQIRPLAFDEVEPRVAAGEVDFLLVNPAVYVELEVRHHLSRIATMRNGTSTQAQNRFGGLIFTRAERDDLSTLVDLRGKRLMAVDPDSLGGFLMPLAVLQDAGLRIPAELATLEFAGIHDAVVLAVRDGHADAGMVRTDILEQMAKQGKIALNDFRPLAARSDADFPFLHSTPLYPEWPFSTLQGTSNHLAQQVAIALLQMPRDDPAAIAGDYAGWTVPLDYQPVHQLLQSLRRPPYDAPDAFTLLDAWYRYWPGVVLALAALLLMLALNAWLQALNARLNRAKSRLEQRQELILDSVAEGIYGVDLDGRTTFVNAAVERLTGWERHQLIGCNQHQLLHHSHRGGTCHDQDDCPVYATFRDQQSRFVEDDLFWRRDGSSFPVEYSSTPIRDHRGRTVGSVVVFRDITERRDSAQRIRRLQYEQARAARLSTLGEMASGIAHEVNQPLTAISTNARASVRLIENGRGSLERCSQVMSKIADQAERAGEIIRNIRRFARKEQPETAPVLVAELFETVLVLLHQEAGQHAVEVRTSIAPGVSAVQVQRTEIEQVILNLARNAIEAMVESAGPHRLWLKAGLGNHGQDLWIRVEDNGPGIAEGIRDRLFEPFVTTKNEGLGLGLSISAGIVEAHGGRLALCETTAGGACFEFNLPAAEVARPPNLEIDPR